MKHNGKKIQVAYLALPDGVNGATVESEADYLVVINKSLASITKRHTIGHELCHIFRDHHSGGRPIREIEREANREAWNYYRAYRDKRL